MLSRRYIILLCVTLCVLQVKSADKYTDENRPYEFGFTIDGEQHRHEKKDENGIIMGEFGFITADGVYHVTVYATDENGNFKILSMKNIRVKPYPTAKSGPERGRSLEYPSSPQISSKPSVHEQNKKQLKELPKPGPASPAKSCSHCKLPTTTTTTTEAPYIPSNNKLPVPAISQDIEIPPKYNQHDDVSAQGYLKQDKQSQQQQQVKQIEQEQQEQRKEQQLRQEQQRQQQQLQQGQQQYLQQQQQQQQLQGQQSLQPQGPHPGQQEEQRQQQNEEGQQLVGLLQQRKQEQQQEQFNNAQNYPAQAIELPQSIATINEPNYPQQSYTKEELQREYQKQQQQQEQHQQRDSNEFPREQSKAPYTIGSPLNYPQQSQSANDNYQQPSYTQAGIQNSPNYETGTSQSHTNLGDKDESNYPGSNILQTQSTASDNQGPMLPLVTNRNPKSYDEQLNKGFNALSSPANAFVPQGNSPPKKPQLISAQMQIVDKNTDIHYKRPGEKEGLPEGLTKNDMSQLLYTFNYTVGFHGHFEEGYKNGAKVGYYYVTGRNGVRTRVDYVADEKGFRPKITQEVLDLLSDDVPKPDTEKDLKYGLKGYEFKWLYYPVDTK
ncbi:PREDICTED: putative uncharacterized protein DDB_G0271606 [Papilio xuthus]|uniref:Protein lethal(3)malignant blood neoplasm 1 n=1 Tax=Papilio xuthus TaxID=66420 RepID=A0AAJ6ZSI8_PAPXU|nr:PREDICTED: putative uncharacterized protein DDB_G0271606 [Papilio xuthus]